MSSRQEVINNLDEYDPYSMSFEDFLYQYNMPYYHLCLNIYSDQPTEYNNVVYDLRAEYMTINKYASEILMQNFSNTRSSSESEFEIAASNDYDNGLV
jgi:hypothetical protein